MRNVNQLNMYLMENKNFFKIRKKMFELPDFNISSPPSETAPASFIKLLDYSKLAEMPEDYEITCEDTARQALSYTLQARKLKNQIEESRKEIVRPHIDFQKAIMKFSKDFSNKLDSIETNLHAKIATWMKEQEENPFCHVEELEVEDGKISMKKAWDFEIVDEEVIPRSFLMPDEDAIKKAITSGIRHIPGIGIFEHQSTQIRVKN